MDNHPFNDVITLLIAMVKGGTQIALALIRRRK